MTQLRFLGKGGQPTAQPPPNPGLWYSLGFSTWDLLLGSLLIYQLTQPGGSWELKKKNLPVILRACLFNLLSVSLKLYFCFLSTVFILDLNAPTPRLWNEKEKHLWCSPWNSYRCNMFLAILLNIRSIVADKMWLPEDTRSLNYLPIPSMLWDP